MRAKPHLERTRLLFVTACFVLACLSSSVFAAVPSIPFTVTMSESVTIAGSPRIILDVDGTTRYAVYTSGSGTASLTFTYTATAGDVDLNGIGISSTSVDLNGGSVTDLNGNVMSDLTFTPPANIGSVNVNYPSLSMDFIYDADGRYTHNGNVYNDITSFITAAGGSFTRTSIATYFDSTGTMQTAASGAPRFDYDPLTLAAKGILIEESRANQALYSTQLDNSYWTKIASSATANVAASPEGGLTGDLLTEDTSNGNHDIRRTGLALAANTTFTLSVYAKPAGRDWVALYASNAAGTQAGYSFFNIGTGTLGTLTTVGSTTASASIQNVSNGWYRCTLTFTQTVNTNRIHFFMATGDGVNSYTGDGSSGVYLWGAQTEQGSFATSYIPTTTAAVTRMADDLKITTGGWFNINTSTLYVQGEAVEGLALGGHFFTGFGSNSINYLGFPYIDSAGAFNGGGYYRSSGAGPVLNPAGALSLGNVFKAAYAFSTTAGTASYVKNGNTVGTGSGVTPMASASYLSVGYAPFNVAPVNAHFLSVKYYPARASDAQIQLLTAP